MVLVSILFVSLYVYFIPGSTYGQEKSGKAYMWYQSWPGVGITMEEALNLSSSRRDQKRKEKYPASVRGRYWKSHLDWTWFNSLPSSKRKKKKKGNSLQNTMLVRS